MVNYNFMKNESFSLISLRIFARLPVANANLLKLKRKRINSFKIIIGFFFTSPLFLATKVAISFVYFSPKTIKCTQKPKIEKSLQESTSRASERVPFSTSQLQLALAHARNLRVKKGLIKHFKIILITFQESSLNRIFVFYHKRCSLIGYTTLYLFRNSRIVIKENGQTVCSCKQKKMKT